MPTLSAFDYAVLRVVPSVERGEFLNAGVVLFCLERRFLQARVQIDDQRLLRSWPDLSLDEVGRHLEAVPRICSGEPAGGPIARLSQRERFHWLVAPRSTMIQVSPVHSGICESPARALEDLYG